MFVATYGASSSNIVNVRGKAHASTILILVITKNLRCMNGNLIKFFKIFGLPNCLG